MSLIKTAKSSELRTEFETSSELKTSDFDRISKSGKYCYPSCSIRTRMKLASPAFGNGERMPDKYTCRGEEVSPPLAWTDPPEGTASFALVAEDLDTPIGVLTHWVVYNIPSEWNELPEALPRAKAPGGRVRQGRNGVFRTGYMGPCPPWGEHRYLFRLYALDTQLDTVIGSKRGLMKAIRDHVLAESELTGTYSKRG